MAAEQAGDDAPASSEPTQVGDDQQLAKSTSKPQSKTVYFSNTDNVYAAFRDRCKRGIKRVHLSPTSNLFVNSLMGIENHDERFLCKEWHIWAEAHPALADNLRADACHSQTVHGEKFIVQFTNEEWRPPKVRIWFVRRHPNYVDGYPPDHLLPHKQAAKAAATAQSQQVQRPMIRKRGRPPSARNKPKCGVAATIQRPDDKCPKTIARPPLKRRRK